MRQGYAGSLRDGGATGLAQHAVGLALVVWTFCHLAFVHANAGGVAWIDAPVVVGVSRAVVVGLLVASVALRGFRLGVREQLLAAAFAAATMGVWSFTHESRFVVLALFVYAAAGLDLERLGRIFVWAALASLAFVLVTTLLPDVPANYFVKNGAAYYSFGFVSPDVIASLLIGISLALVLTMPRTWWIPLAVILALVIATMIVALGTKREALFLLLPLACVVAQALKPDVLRRVAASNVARWTVALLPWVLGLLMVVSTFCYSGDNPLFSLLDRLAILRASSAHGAYVTYEAQVDGDALGALVGMVFNPELTRGFFEPVQSAYVQIPFVYGAIPLVCLGVLHAWSVLSLEDDDRLFLHMSVLALVAVLLVYERHMLYLEFNVALLLLSFGAAGPAGLATMAPRGVTAEPTATVRDFGRLVSRAKARGSSFRKQVAEEESPAIESTMRIAIDRTTSRTSGQLGAISDQEAKGESGDMAASSAMTARPDVVIAQSVVAAQPGVAAQSSGIEPSGVPDAADSDMETDAGSDGYPTPRHGRHFAPSQARGAAARGGARHFHGEGRG